MIINNDKLIRNTNIFYKIIGARKKTYKTVRDNKYNIREDWEFSSNIDININSREVLNKIQSCEFCSEVFNLYRSKTMELGKSILENEECYTGFKIAFFESEVYLVFFEMAVEDYHNLNNVLPPRASVLKITVFNKTMQSSEKFIGVLVYKIRELVIDTLCSLEVFTKEPFNKSVGLIDEIYNQEILEFKRRKNSNNCYNKYNKTYTVHKGLKKFKPNEIDDVILSLVGEETTTLTSRFVFRKDYEALKKADIRIEDYGKILKVIYANSNLLDKLREKNKSLNTRKNTATIESIEIDDDIFKENLQEEKGTTTNQTVLIGFDDEEGDEYDLF